MVYGYKRSSNNGYLGCLYFLDEEYSKMSETYISTDIEADGPIPGMYSMLSFGSAAFKDGLLIDQFTANLLTLPNATTDPSTMEWWNQDRNKKAYEATRVNAVEPVLAMKSYVAWLKTFNSPVFVGYPAGFDFTFIYWYLMAFAGESPFSFSGLDMKSYAMAKLKTPFRATVKKNFPYAWKKVPGKHTHIALDDAIEQGWMFMNMLKD